ncbi:MAG: polyprenyl diphosphate synthase [Candidatus Bathyarchaeia archaeon]
MIRDLLRLVGVYRLYERWLMKQLDGRIKVEHIAVIADERVYHKVGGEPANSLSSKVIDLLKWCVELDVKCFTIYALSTDYLRARKGHDGVLEALENGLRSILLDGILHRYQVRFKAIGKVDLFPERIKGLIASLEESTRGYVKYFLNLALAYGGRTEIVDAARKMAKDVKLGKIEPESVEDLALEGYLYTSYLPKQDPDLIVRTSGDERLSGFLLWQSAYSELCFLDVDWVDLRKVDILRAIRTFQKRRRRFGL